VVVLDLADVDHHVLERDELHLLPVHGLLDRAVHRIDLAERREVRLEADPLHFRVGDGLRDGLGHLAFADVGLEPARLEVGLLLVSEVGDEEEFLLGDEPDRVVAGEVGQVRQVRRVREQQRVELELLHRVADGLVTDFEVRFGASDGDLHSTFPRGRNGYGGNRGKT
jgi:hypothetical protein